MLIVDTKWFKCARTFFGIRALIFLILILFSACSKKSDFTKFLEVKESKSFDLPLPLGYKFEKKLGCYSGILSNQQVIEFYKTNLENLGWKIQDYSNEIEGLLLCDKVSKSTIISIRNSIKNNKKRNQIFIFNYKN